MKAKRIVDEWGDAMEVSILADKVFLKVIDGPHSEPSHAELGFTATQAINAGLALIKAALVLDGKESA